MTAFLFEIAGDGIEILGVFFLSVEAIKLENLFKLRDRFLRPMEHRLQPGTFQPSKSEWTFEEFRAEQLALRHFFLTHYGVGLTLVILIILLLAHLSSRFASILWNPFITPRRAVITSMVFLLALFPIAATLIATRRGARVPPLGIMLGVTMATIPIGLIAMLFGEAAHQGSRLLIRVTLRLLEAIARGTPTGTIGILGFVGVCIGKIVQLLAGLAQH